MIAHCILNVFHLHNRYVVQWCSYWFWALGLLSLLQIIFTSNSLSWFIAGCRSQCVSTRIAFLELDSSGVMVCYINTRFLWNFQLQLHFVRYNYGRILDLHFGKLYVFGHPLLVSHQRSKPLLFLSTHRVAVADLFQRMMPGPCSTSVVDLTSSDDDDDPDLAAANRVSLGHPVEVPVSDAPVPEVQPSGAFERVWNDCREAVLPPNEVQPCGALERVWNDCREAVLPPRAVLHNWRSPQVRASASHLNSTSMAVDRDNRKLPMLFLKFQLQLIEALTGIFNIHWADFLHVL